MNPLLLFMGLLPPCDVTADDVWRFPYTDVEINARVDFAFAHKERIKLARPYDTAWQNDALARWSAWAQLHDARLLYDKVNHVMSHPDGLMALHYLREMIGADNYMMGRMPDHVPISRFTPRDR